MQDGYDHFVFSTVITVTLDPVEHKIVRLEDEWAGIDAALAKGGPGARSDMPKWFVTMQRERRDLTMEAAHKDW